MPPEWLSAFAFLLYYLVLNKENDDNKGEAIAYGKHGRAFYDPEGMKDPKAKGEFERWHEDQWW